MAQGTLEVAAARIVELEAELARVQTELRQARAAIQEKERQHVAAIKGKDDRIAMLEKQLGQTEKAGKVREDAVMRGGS